MKLVLLSGGVGGARLARGLAAHPDIELTVVVNTGDDDISYGLSVSPDLDTVMYTIARTEGPQGWGRLDDSFTVMGHLADLGIETSFQIGDADLAVNLLRTHQLRQGAPLSDVTYALATRLGVSAELLPMSDQPVRTMVRTADGTWRSFKEYFVERGHRDAVVDVRFDGVMDALPAPGVIDAIRSADAVVIGPSNPVLSIWPILAVPGVAGAVAACPRAVVVSPLFGGEALKGPAHEVMAGVGLPPGNAGIAAAYDGLANDMVIDTGDSTDRSSLTTSGLAVHVHNTLMISWEQSMEFAEWLAKLIADGND